MIKRDSTANQCSNGGQPEKQYFERERYSQYQTLFFTGCETKPDQHPVKHEIDA